MLFNRGRSLVIALSLSIARWPLKMSDYPLLYEFHSLKVHKGVRTLVLCPSVIAAMAVARYQCYCCDGCCLPGGAQEGHIESAHSAGCHDGPQAFG